MKTIWKFELAAADGRQTISMPFGAEVLTAQLQAEFKKSTEGVTIVSATPCIWALVDDDKAADPETRTFDLVGTGHPFIDDKPRKFVGTLQVSPRIVSHVFEVLESSAVN